MTEEHLTTFIGNYAVVLKEKKMLIVCPPKGELWILPGGRMNVDDKTPFTALAREVKEELGLELINARPVHTDFWGEKASEEQKGISTRFGVFYVCEVKPGQIKLSNEHVSWKYASYDELYSHFSQHDRAIVGIRLITELRKQNLL